MGAYFRSSSNFTNSNYSFTEVDAYAFTAASDNTPVTVNLSGTLNNVVSQLNQVSGISAKLVKTNSIGTATYSIVLESDETGLNGGFKITEAGATADGRQLKRQQLTQAIISLVNFQEMHL